MSVNTESVRQELAHRAELPAGPKGVLELIDRNEVELGKLLGPDLSVEAFRTAAMTYLRLSPKLWECNPYSVVGGLRQGAQLGFQLGPLGLFYLVPFKTEAVFIVGYRGFVELAYRSGLVKDLSAELVYEGDPFKVTKGTSPKIVHEDAGAPGERPIVAAYAVARLRTGGTVSKVIYEDDWEAARQASALGRKNEGLWAEHRPAAIRKTAIRRLEPLLPKTPALASAFVADETRQPAMIEGDDESGASEDEPRD